MMNQFIQAKADLENAQLALKEYESSTIPRVKQHESDVFVSRENLRRSEFLAFSVKLAARDYIPEVQLEADRFAVEEHVRNWKSLRQSLMFSKPLPVRRSLSNCRLSKKR